MFGTTNLFANEGSMALLIQVLVGSVAGAILERVFGVERNCTFSQGALLGVDVGEGRDFFRGEIILGVVRGELEPSFSCEVWKVLPMVSSKLADCFDRRVFCFAFKASIHDNRRFGSFAADVPPMLSSSFHSTLEALLFIRVSWIGPHALSPFLLLGDGNAVILSLLFPAR